MKLLLALCVVAVLGGCSKFNDGDKVRCIASGREYVVSFTDSPLVFVRDKSENLKPFTEGELILIDRRPKNARER